MASHFQQQLAFDIGAVFLNLDEFGEIHRIEGKEIPVSVDKDQLNKLKKGQNLGLEEADTLLIGRKSDFPDYLPPGRLINMDGREMIVVKSWEDIGVVEVALRQNRTG